MAFHAAQTGPTCQALTGQNTAGYDIWLSALSGADGQRGGSDRS